MRMSHIICTLAPAKVRIAQVRNGITRIGHFLDALDRRICPQQEHDAVDGFVDGKDGFLMSPCEASSMPGVSSPCRINQMPRQMVAALVSCSTNWGTALRNMELLVVVMRAFMACA